MACCAFAVFVLMQIAAPFVWLWQHTFGRNRRATNAAVTWSYGDVVLATPGAAALRMPLLRKGLVLALAFELIVVVAAVQSSVRADTSAEAWAWAEALHDSWCRAPVRG